MNGSAVEVMGDENPPAITQELTQTARRNATIGWTLPRNVCTDLRTRVSRILRKHGDPPDQQEIATRMMLEQAELLSANVS